MHPVLIRLPFLPESFAETPGVLVQKTANGHGSPFIRGFTGFRNLLLVDGIRLNSRTAPARRSGIVSFGHETIAPGMLYQGLRERGISCALREGGVRVSPHFYQGESELTVFLDALAHIV